MSGSHGLNTAPVGHSKSFFLSAALSCACHNREKAAQTIICWFGFGDPRLEKHGTGIFCFALSSSQVRNLLCFRKCSFPKRRPAPICRLAPGPGWGAHILSLLPPRWSSFWYEHPLPAPASPPCPLLPLLVLLRPITAWLLLCHSKRLMWKLLADGTNNMEKSLSLH